MPNFRYYISIVDEFSRFIWFYFILNKSDFFSIFVKFHDLIERYLGLKIREVQIDLGGEFMNSTFKKYLEEHGINQKMSCTYTPQQHGIFERKHRQIVEVGRCLLIKSGIHHEYWPKVFSSSIYLINRLRTPTLDNRSPYEL